MHYPIQIRVMYTRQKRTSCSKSHNGERIDFINRSSCIILYRSVLCIRVKNAQVVANPIMANVLFLLTEAHALSYTDPCYVHA